MSEFDLRMNATPCFSVVIPLYNRAQLIESTLRSVLGQSFQDFEVVVVDDGSVDEPEAVLARMADARIRYVRQENQGANVARNRGIDEARGRYIAFLDSDDRFLPHHLEKSAEALGQNPGAVVFARVVVDRGEGSTFLKPPRGPKPGEPISEYLTCDRGFVQTSTLCVPVDLARQVRYLEWLPFGQDIDFAIRLAAAGARFVMLEEPGAVWLDRADPKRISSKSNPAMRLRWLNYCAPMMTLRAQRGFKGWFAAKAMVQHGQRAQAFGSYFSAVTAGCYKPKLAVTVGLQLLLAGGGYRRIADAYLKLRKALR